MDFMHGIRALSEVSEVKGSEEQSFSQRSLDKYDKILGDNEFDERCMSEEEKQDFANEVFNPETDYEFSEFDFEDERLKEVLDYFNEPTWERLDTEDRKAVVQAFTGYLTEKLNISEMPTVIYRQMPEYRYGGYDDKNNVILLNEKLLDHPKKLMHTAAHEMRHAYQHERAEIGRTHQDVLYRYNFENYISAWQDKNGNWIGINEYQNQWVEVEAEEFAKRIADVRGIKGDGN